MGLVIEDDMKKIRRLIETNRRKRAELHQRSAVSVNNDNPLLRQRMRHTETNRRRSAHAANDVEMVRAIRDRKEFAAGFSSSSKNVFVPRPKGNSHISHPPL